MHKKNLLHLIFELIPNHWIRNTTSYNNKKSPAPSRAGLFNSWR